MPTSLDFGSTKPFRDFIIGKTLTVPNGPQTFTPDNYIVQKTSDMANVDPGDVVDNTDTSREQQTTKFATSNVYKPDDYFIVEDVYTQPRSANLDLYPSFVNGNYHSFVSIMSTSNYETESELMKFAAWNIKENPEGPFYARMQQNLYTTTAGKVRLLDALEGNTTTAINILTGREPLVEMNNRITVAKTLPGKGIDFLQTVTGVEFPWSEIPGDYLSNPKNPISNLRPTAPTEGGKLLQDITGALGSLFGIQRRPTVTRKPSDLFIEYMGARQKTFLNDALSYSTYGPDYTTEARSQNTSKVFNFADQFGKGIKTVFGMESPKKYAYIGDDRGNDVKFAMNDFNDRPVRSNYFLSYLFDQIQAQLFQRKKNIGEGGSIAGKLTWISSKSKNKLGVNNAEYQSEASQFEETLSTNYPFRGDSILGLTQEILETLPTDGGVSRSHVANVIDQTSRVFREGDVMMSRGSAIKYVNKFTGTESGVEYCRVWTKDRSYMNYSDTMKRTGNVRKFESSILDAPWNINIYPNSNGNGAFDGSTNIVKGNGGFYAKKYMFSIENLAWKTSNTPGFTYSDLPYCERGPNGGRVMWFPPYDLKVQEQNSAKWESNVFLGRPEPVYTYQNAERNGSISFKVIVDHPSILNLLVKEHFKNMSDEEADNYINAFFAGCEQIDFYDLIRKYATLTPDDVTAIQNYLGQGRPDPNTAKQYAKLIDPKPDAYTPKNSPNLVTVETQLYFKNDYPSIVDSKILYSGSKEDYETLYEQYKIARTGYINDLNYGLDLLVTGTTWSPARANDFRTLTLLERPQRPSQEEIDAMRVKANNDIVTAFDALESNYEQFKTDLETLKTYLASSEVEDVNIILQSRTSQVADDKYNLKLAYRRSHSVLVDVINKIAASEEAKTACKEKIKWQGPSKESEVEKTEPPITITLKDLGYPQLDGNFTIEYTSNLGEQPVPKDNIDCTDEYSILTSSALKRTVPRTFWCRESAVQMKYLKKSAEDVNPAPPQSEPQPVEVADTPERVNNTPPIDELKRIIMKTLSECYYFKKLEEDSPQQFSSLKEKLRYFHPAFHSMTPEGLNSRLTFLHQCLRPGDTLPIKGISDASDLNARNTTFGPPPICILRVGDFYHSKIIIKDVQISFEDTTWDLNPEGIGVQPMLANVTLQINFIGGHGLEKPVERLQNALSSNFYANTEMYDPRSITTNSVINGKDATTFTKEFLDDLVKNNDAKLVGNQTSQTIPTTTITNGQFIGSYGMRSISPPISVLFFGGNSGPSQTDKFLVDKIFDQNKAYIDTYMQGYNAVYKKYDSILSSIFLSPTYRTIKDYTVQTGAGTETIQLLGEYKKGSELEVLTSDFKVKILDKITNENISTIFGFDNIMTSAVLKSSEDILKPWVLKTIGEKVDKFTQEVFVDTAIKNRNELIITLDKLNFMVEHLHDGKIVGDRCIGVNLTGFTYDKLYNEYSNIIKFIKDNQDKFTEDLDSSTYKFDRYTTMTTNNLSYFLSVLLKAEKQNILKLYEKDKGTFTERIISDMGNKLDRFLLKDPSDKNFRITEKSYPKRKNNNLLEFRIIDESYTFNDTQIEQLRNVHRTSRNKTVSTLNYYR